MCYRKEPTRATHSSEQVIISESTDSILDKIDIERNQPPIGCSNGALTESTDDTLLHMEKSSSCGALPCANSVPSVSTNQSARAGYDDSD